MTVGACSNDDDVVGGGDDSEQEEADEAENELAIFGGQAADAEPLSLTEQLEEDIEEVLGEADDDATDVVAGDTVQTVIDRADDD